MCNEIWLQIKTVFLYEMSFTRWAHTHDDLYWGLFSSWKARKESVDACVLRYVIISVGKCWLICNNLNLVESVVQVGGVGVSEFVLSVILWPQARENLVWRKKIYNANLDKQKWRCLSW